MPRSLPREETWKPVAGYEGLYEISNRGRVRSLRRIVAMNYGHRKRVVAGRILQPAKDCFGYQKVSLCKDGKQKECHIHRLVASAFVHGVGDVVRHLDGDPGNSVANNLAWGTFKDNEADKRRHGRILFGTRHPRAKITDETVRSVRSLYFSGLKQIDIAKKLGLNRGTVHFIVRGKQWTHV